MRPKDRAKRKSSLGVVCDFLTGLQIFELSPGAMLTRNCESQKKCVGSVLPHAEAERPPRARGTWSGMGRRGAELPTPLCLRSSASSSYLYPVLVSVPGSVSPGALRIPLLSIKICPQTQCEGEAMQNSTRKAWFNISLTPL